MKKYIKVRCRSTLHNFLILVTYIYELVKLITFRILRQRIALTFIVILQ